MRRRSPALPVAVGQRSCSCERGTWTAADTQPAGLDLYAGDKARGFSQDLSPGELRNWWKLAPSKQNQSQRFTVKQTAAICSCCQPMLAHPLPVGCRLGCRVLCVSERTGCRGVSWPSGAAHADETATNAPFGRATAGCGTARWSLRTTEIDKKEKVKEVIV